MERIASFSIDHTTLVPGMYVSRIDGDVTTYDMRFTRPNTGHLLTNAQMHSFEHMFATYIRNGFMGGNVIYFGPMGCQTGFYLLVRAAEKAAAEKAVTETLDAILAHEGEVFGKSPLECGNYLNLDLGEAKSAALLFKQAFTGIRDYADIPANG